MARSWEGRHGSRRLVFGSLPEVFAVREVFPPSSGSFRSVPPSPSTRSRRIHSCAFLSLSLSLSLSIPSLLCISSQRWLHPFRRFCPPTRETINFPALNPSRGTDHLHDRGPPSRFYNTQSVYTASWTDVPACTDFACLVYRPDDVFMRLTHTSAPIQSRYSRHPLSRRPLSFSKPCRAFPLIPLSSSRFCFIFRKVLDSLGWSSRCCA